MKRQLVLVPRELMSGDIDTLTALEWCTDKVMALDAENQRLRERLEKYERVPALQGTPA